MGYKENYVEWLAYSEQDAELKQALTALTDEREIEERFYMPLSFGTAGMRGKLGCGTNRMNRYVIAKATQGVAQYLLKADPASAEKGVAISYDSRNFSAEFAEITARVLAANGVKAYLSDELRPVPVLSFMVRHLQTAAGIVITASHNPKEYNGYKVYGPDGGQITEAAVDGIVAEIEKVESYFTVAMAALNDPHIVMVGKEIDDAYIEAVRPIYQPRENTDLNIIYTPLHGSGNKPVRRLLAELGFTNVRIVKEQELPDGDFPTVKLPNPEEQSAFDLAIAMAQTEPADVLIGTDPDSDRIGVVCRTAEGEYKVFTGNQTGILLTDYLLKTRAYPENKAIIKTIVTGELSAVIAKAHGAQCFNTLTGFKYIGEKMTQWRETGEYSYVFGYEESYGYLAGEHARDKDGVSTAALICEMAQYYKDQGMTLYDALEAIYQQYGYYIDEGQSIYMEGIEGKAKIAALMDAFRAEHIEGFADEKLVTFNDYKLSISTDAATGLGSVIALPKSNVLKFIFDKNSWLAIRPSGTEPKIKFYYSVMGRTRAEAENKLAALKRVVNERLEK